MRAAEAEATLLVLPDGRVLAHNLTPALAEVLAAVNPRDEAMQRRAGPRRTKQMKSGTMNNRGHDGHQGAPPVPPPQRTTDE